MSITFNRVRDVISENVVQPILFRAGQLNHYRITVLDEAAYRLQNKYLASSVFVAANLNIWLVSFKVSEFITNRLSFFKPKQNEIDLKPATNKSIAIIAGTIVGAVAGNVMIDRAFPVLTTTAKVILAGGTGLFLLLNGYIFGGKEVEMKKIKNLTEDKPIIIKENTRSVAENLDIEEEDDTASVSDNGDADYASDNGFSGSDDNETETIITDVAEIHA